MNRKINISIVSLSILGITALHLFTAKNMIYLHIIYKFIYLLPIAFIGFREGRKAGIIIALFCILAYSPHFFMENLSKSFLAENILGMIIFLVVGVLSGAYHDIKLDFITTKYEAIPECRKNKDGDTTLFYADDSPISTNCAQWLANNFLSNNDVKIKLLYGPVYSQPGESQADHLKNKTISLKELKKIITQLGFSKDRIDISLVQTDKRVPLSRIILNEIDSDNFKFILIGKHPINKSQEFLFGDTALSLVRESPIPVIVLTSKKCNENI